MKKTHSYTHRFICVINPDSRCPKATPSPQTSQCVILPLFVWLQSPIGQIKMEHSVCKLYLTVTRIGIPETLHPFFMVSFLGFSFHLHQVHSIIDMSTEDYTNVLKTAMKRYLKKSLMLALSPYYPSKSRTLGEPQDDTCNIQLELTGMD